MTSAAIHSSHDSQRFMACPYTASRDNVVVTASQNGTVDGVNAALRAGVDSIEHGTVTNDEPFRLYKQTGAYYVPTLLAPAAALAEGQRGALTPAQIAAWQQNVLALPRRVFAHEPGDEHADLARFLADGGSLAPARRATS